MNKLAIYLNRHLIGNVFDKDSILDAYSTDRSLLKIKPRLVAVPETTSDVRKICRFANQLSEKGYDLKIAVRGAGLSKTGSDLTSGLVISTEKLNHVRELDAHDRLVHVQAGMTLGKLNAILAPNGLTLPVSADPEETIGGLIATAPRDDYSKRYGGIMNYVDRIEVVLANGDLIQTSRIPSGKLIIKKVGHSLESEIYEKLDKLLIKNSELISTLPETSRLGYPGLKYIKRNNGHVFDLLPAFFGSEGSLGIITEVILRCEVLPPREHRLFAVFNKLKPAEDFMTSVEKLDPLSVRLFDNRIFKRADDFGKKPDLLTRKFDEEGYLVLVSFNDKTPRSRRKVKKCLRLLPKSAYVFQEFQKDAAEFDAFDSTLVSYLNDSGSKERPNLLHDFYVPKEKLEELVEKLAELEKTYKRPLELYGSHLADVYSVRPEFNLEKIDDRRACLTLLRDFNNVLKDLGGNLAGGLPEGRLKSLVVYSDIDEKEKKLYSTVKKIFDKNNILAPGIKTDCDIKNTIRHLRAEPLSGIIN